jgi:hypothetical protein
MDSKLDFDKFYKFGEESIDSPMTFAAENYKEKSFEELKKFYHGEFINEKPKTFIQTGGKDLCDLMSAGAPSFYVLSERVISSLKDNDITGWASYPVALITNSKEKTNNYHALYILGKADKADKSISKKIEVVLPNKSRKIKDKGYFFPQDSWEDTDFFHHVETLGSITVTERVKLIFESLQVTNVKFKKCSEYIWP